MKQNSLPRGCNYVGLFLTFRCNYSCGYCINRFDGQVQAVQKELPYGKWLEFINSLPPRQDLPVTLQGGEPSLYKGFYGILKNLKDGIKVDMLTNLSFDVGRFIGEAPAAAFNRKAPYASIRITYHPGYAEAGTVARDAGRLIRAGFSAGVWVIKYPAFAEKNREMEERCRAAGIDCRPKEFLGRTGNRMYGTFRYDRRRLKADGLSCRTTEILIAPDGLVYGCHAALYSGRSQVADMTGTGFKPEIRWRACGMRGQCNPCDIKIKYDRFQRPGHTAVAVRDDLAIIKK